MKTIKPIIIILLGIINIFSQSVFLLKNFSFSNSWSLTSKPTLNLFSILNSCQNSLSFTKRFFKFLKVYFINLVCFMSIYQILFHFLSFRSFFLRDRFFSLFIFYKLSIHLYCCPFCYIFKLSYFRFFFSRHQLFLFFCMSFVFICAKSHSDKNKKESKSDPSLSN